MPGRIAMGPGVKATRASRFPVRAVFNFAKFVQLKLFQELGHSAPLGESR